MVESLSAPCGTWTSPISAELVARQGLRLAAPSVDGRDVYWLEGRPQEGGRNVLVRWRDGSIDDVVPAGFNVRTRVHEYGGGAYLVANGIVYCSNFQDQRVYRIAPGGDPEPLTPASSTSSPACFYGDYALDERRRRLVAVREDHRAPGEPVNTLVEIPLDGPPVEGRALASGFDFYSTPRLSPDGTQLTWLSWRHPNMPWDGTELWVARVGASGDLEDATRIAGGNGESIYQPGWSPDGALYFASDRDGWWRLYCVRDEGTIAPVLSTPPADTEFGRAQWLLGSATWSFAGARRLVVSSTSHGVWRLGAVDIDRQTFTPLIDGFEPSEWLTSTADHAVLIAGSPTMAPAVVRVDLGSGAVESLRVASSLSLPEGSLSVPVAVDFPTTGGRAAHAFYYAPANPNYRVPDGEAPPLIVIGHGGPTYAARASLDLHIQYWTSRGFAVADVNYGGSTGYGRAYRERLNGQWGIVDVEDTVNAATFLVSQGKADGRRLVVRGGSAGGYTTLAALTVHPEVFGIGVSYYGVSDVEVLARDTHKFESRYLDSLIGPYPERRDLYRERSPIHAVDRLSCGLLLLQGLDDKVVPPNQSEMMADAARRKGLPVAYLAFEGEQHGFRRAETIVRALEAELFFYGAVFGFRPADAIEPVPIDNLEGFGRR